MGNESAKQAIEAAREWQENDEVAIDPEIVEDLIEELEARLNPWQPIETAPKDGTTVLLVWKWDSGVHRGVNVIMAHWGCRAHEHQSKHHDCPNEIDCRMTWGAYAGDFTHWTPLPELPEGETR